MRQARGMPSHPSHSHPETLQPRHNNPCISQDFPKFSRRSKRSPRPATALAALAVLASVSPSPSNASPVPIPFLEFLYPSFLSSHPSPPSSSASSPTRSQQHVHQPSRELKDALPARKSRNKGKQTTYYPNVLSKRAAAQNVNIPTKYESAGVGWVLAESWDLHGRHRRTQTTSTDPVGPTNIQNLDAADTGNFFETSENLDLPYGWDNHGSRHESYDPVIVSVFAVILVISIVITTGLCRWRSKKARRLRDLERLEQEQKSDSGSETSSVVNEKRGKNTRKKIRNSTGRSTGFKRINDRLTARMRRKRRAKNNPARHGDDIQDNPDQTANIRDLDVAASHREALDTPRPSLEGSIQDLQPQDPSAPLDDSARHSISGNIDRPLTPEHESRTLDPTPTTLIRPPSSSQHGETTGPTALPPAYRSSSIVRVHSGKAPIRGFEDDYDERSLTGYRRSANAALPLHAQSTSHAPHISIDQLLATAEEVPPFEQSQGTEDYSVQIANGATRRAHVATDDKAVLERMRRLANEPSVYSTHPPGPSSPTNSVPPSPNRISSENALVPTWCDLDEFDAEQQIEAYQQVSPIHDVQPASSVTGLVAPQENNSDTFATASNVRRLATALVMPPPASPSAFISATLQGGEGYGLGHVWTGLGDSTSGGPSCGAGDHSLPHAPPNMPDEPGFESGLLPSAPPLENLSLELPSAPPEWDEDIDDVNTAQHSPSSGTPAPCPVDTEATSNLTQASEDVNTNADTHDHPTNQDSEPNQAGEHSEHGDTSDSSSDTARWSLTLRTRAEEGAGLPRYEP